MIQVELKIPEFCDNVREIPNAGTARHGALLYGLVKWLRPSVVVEVGSLGGYTAAWMARALYENQSGHIWLIDDFSLVPDSRDDLEGNLEQLGLKGTYTILEGRSTEVVWPTPVDMAFIDGDHSYEGCRNDVLKAMSCGATTIVIHDTTGWWGPRDLIEEIRSGLDAWKFWDVMECCFDSGLTVLRKREAKPPVTFSQEKYPTGWIEEDQMEELRQRDARVVTE